MRGSAISDAHPPSSDSVMSRVEYPNARAVSECPSSCATIDSAKASAKLSPYTNDPKSITNRTSRMISEKSRYTGIPNASHTFIFLGNMPRILP